MSKNWVVMLRCIHESKYVALKTIERRGTKLFVPVGKTVWNTLKDSIRCVDVAMFWEDYMKEFAPLLFSTEDSDLDKIKDIHFKRGSHTLSFITEDGISQNFIKVKGSDEGEFILDFKLNYRAEGNTLIKIGHSTEVKDRISHLLPEEDEEVEFKNPYPIFISTPMGGMTRWKR